MTGDPVMAQDLTQETYLRAIRALPSFRADASARTWLLSIARRTWPAISGSVSGLKGTMSSMRFRKSPRSLQTSTSGRRTSVPGGCIRF